MISLNQNDKKIVLDILKENISNCEIRVFGSRVTEKVKKYSDLDLVLVGEKVIDKKIIYKLMEEFEYSELNIRVDLIDYQNISDSFRRIIDEKNELLISL